MFKHSWCLLYFLTFAAAAVAEGKYTDNGSGGGNGTAYGILAATSLAVAATLAIAPHTVGCLGLSPGLMHLHVCYSCLLVRDLVLGSPVQRQSVVIHEGSIHGCQYPSNRICVRYLRVSWCLLVGTAGLNQCMFCVSATAEDPHALATHARHSTSALLTIR